MAYRQTRIPNLIVDYKIKEKDDGTVRATGIAIDRRTNEEIKELGTLISRAISSKRHEHAVYDLLAKFENAYTNVFGQVNTKEQDMEEAYKIICEEVRSGHRRLKPTWKDQLTNTRPLIFFERNILKDLLPYSDPEVPFVESARLSLQNRLEAEAMHRNGGDLSKARESTYERLIEADLIYSHMREINPFLPPLVFTSAIPPEVAPREEQIKSLPRTVLTTFYLKLYDQIQFNPKKVFFAVLCVHGFRPSEAAGVKPQTIIWNDTFCVVPVAAQEKKGRIVAQLKNEFSRRIVIIPSWGREMLRQCCNAIGDNYPHDECSMNHAQECSRWTKSLLLACGYAASDFNTLAGEISKDDLDDDEPSDDNMSAIADKIACYVLRRVFASICRNVMGLSLYVTDRLLGHEPRGAEAKAIGPDMNAVDVQRKIAEMMERYIFIPEFSNNPCVNPYKLSELDQIELIPFTEYHVLNDTDQGATLQGIFHACEMGEPIKIYCKSLPDNLFSSSIDNTWANTSRLVIGDTTPPPKRRLQKNVHQESTKHDP